MEGHKPARPAVFPEPTMDSGSQQRLRLVLGAVLVPMVVASFIVYAANGRPPAATVAVVLSDATNAHVVEIRDANGAVVLSGEFRSRVDTLGNIEKDAELTGAQGDEVIGEVEIEFPAPDREHRRPELEVDIIHLLPRQRYSVVVDDRVVGIFVTDDRGSIDLELQEGETLDRTALPF